MDFRRLRTGEIVAAGSALALFVVMFLSWYGLEEGPEETARLIAGSGRDTTDSAWEAFGVLDFYLLVVIVAALGLAVLTAAQRTPAVPVAADVVLVVLSALAVALVALRLVAQPGPNDAVAVEYGVLIGEVGRPGPDQR